MKRIVVGYDASHDADQALRWAVEHARVADLPMRVVVARGDLHTVSGWADRWTRGLAQEWAEEAEKELGDLGATNAEVVVVDGTPADALLEESRDAQCVVVGGRGRRAPVGPLLGSVSEHVTRHATSTVVAVRGPQDADARTVVVGFDGSPPSQAALEFALHYAGLHQLTVQVVYVPDHFHWYGEEVPAGLMPELLAELTERDERAIKQAADLVARHSGVDAEIRRVRGSAGHVLVDASRHAALVVVGSRGRGGFAGLLMGSVSANVLHRAHCPVAVSR